MGVADECPTSEGLLKVVAMLEEVGSWIDEIPPVEQPMRFGNKAFRTWYDYLPLARNDVGEKEVKTGGGGGAMSLR